MRITSELTEPFCSSSQLESVSVFLPMMCCTSLCPTHPEPPLTSAACRPELSSGSQRVPSLISSLTSGTLGSPDGLSGHSSPSDSGRCWCFCQERSYNCSSSSGCWWLSGWYLDCCLSDPAGLLRVSGWTSERGHEGTEQTGPSGHFHLWGISPWLCWESHPGIREYFLSGSPPGP